MKMQQYSKFQISSLIILRLLIGWHFLYEGLIKVFNPNWTAYHYLMDSQGFFAEYFYNIASNTTLLSIANVLNTYGLILVGLGLILGCLSKWSSICGVVLLLMYCLSHPPFIGAEYLMPAEGSYLWIDKNLVEMAALIVLTGFPTSHIIGLDRYLHKILKCK
ncbi:MAG: DoxX family membrane protein [Prevotellaceae bacterium]|nr:DoxX family membrane protein [Prevotellaceae bacterium]